MTDQIRLAELSGEDRVTDSVATFVPGPGIERLDTRVDLARPREAVDIAIDRSVWKRPLFEQDAP